MEVLNWMAEHWLLTIVLAYIASGWAHGLAKALLMEATKGR